MKNPLRKKKAQEEDDDEEVKEKELSLLDQTDRILSPSYLDSCLNSKSSSGNHGKKDLLRRLRNIVFVLENNDAIDPSYHQVPDGLPALGQLLCRSFLNEDEDHINHHHSHSKKENEPVRLYSVLACLEILAVYAPELPFDETECIRIFQQVIAQVGNLKHTIDPVATKQQQSSSSSSQPYSSQYYEQYVHILELLAHVKMGVILIDMERSSTTSTPLSSSPTITESPATVLPEPPNQVLTRLFHALLNNAVNKDHSQQVKELVQESLAACLVEYHHRFIPIPLLDEILLCIGRGPTVWVPNLNHSLAHTATAAATATTTSNHNADRNKTNKKKSAPAHKPQQQALPPLMVEETNTSYEVAKSVVLPLLSSTLETSIAQLLNGLLTSAPHFMNESNIEVDFDHDAGDQIEDDTLVARTWHGQDETVPHLHNIIFELHRIAPSILTTVMGTLAQDLSNIDDRKRLATFTLLGRIWTCTNTNNRTRRTRTTEQSREGIVHFRAVYREWLCRSQDVSLTIRKRLVLYLCQIMKQRTIVQASSSVPSPTTTSTATAESVADEACRTLFALMVHDPSTEVRQDVIYRVSDAIYHHKAAAIASSSTMVVPVELLKAIGSRVSSKHPGERTYALTGLSQIYYRHYVQEKLRPIQVAFAENDGGGDSSDMNVDIVTVLSTLQSTCSLRSRNAKKAARGGSHNKTRRRIGTENSSFHSMNESDDDLYRWIPRKIFESVCITDQIDTDMRSRLVQIVDEVLLGSELSSKSSKKLHPAARAIGFTMILDSLFDEDSWEYDKSDSFKFLHQLFERRALLQTELGKYLDARDQMRRDSSGTQEWLLKDAKARDILHVVGTLTAPPSGSTSLDDILNLIHGAKDKHIFRLLSTIADPLQKSKTRRRAIDELPKLVVHFGEATVTWMKTLVRRCNMGDFMNRDVVAHCTQLAQQCFAAEDIPACLVLLSAVEVSVRLFPHLGSSANTFETLQELLVDCLRLFSSNLKHDVEETGIISTITSILKDAATKRAILVTVNAKQEGYELCSAELRRQLLQLSVRVGTPEQARNAVYTLALLIPPSPDPPSPAATDFVEPDLVKLLNALAIPLRSTMDSANTTSIIRILSALTALADCAPHVFVATDRGMKLVTFTIEAVLLGQNGNNDHSSGKDACGDEVIDSSCSKKKRASVSPSMSHNHLSPRSNINFLEDENLSCSCKKVCAGIELLVTLLRSIYLRGQHTVHHETSRDLAKRIFSVLAQILQNGGFPLSSHDRRSFNAHQDRSALRQCCGVSLLRLCDKRLGYESSFLTPSLCRILSDSFLDEERVVRQAMGMELTNMFNGTGLFGLQGSGINPQPPSLRCLSFIVLCSDGDHGVENDVANGGAANIGNLARTIHHSSLACIENLRRLSHVMQAQLKASVPDADKVYEQKYKHLLMPEYVIPFVFYLLVHRRETPLEMSLLKPPPSAVSKSDRSLLSDSTSLDEGANQNRILRKRLRLILEPLVRSLGDKAENISFLLRMTAILEQQYQIAEVDVDAVSTLDSNIQSEDRSRRLELDSKLQVVCATARAVLFSFVKRDANLVTYPGKIQIPRIFVKKVVSTGQTKRLFPAKDSESFLPGLRTRVRGDTFPDRLSSPIAQSEDAKADQLTPKYAAGDRKVFFSPNIEIKVYPGTDPLTGDDGKVVSPITKSKSPHSLKRKPLTSVLSNSHSRAPIQSSSPPSALRTISIPSSFESPSTESDASNSPFLSLTKRKSNSLGVGMPQVISLKDRQHTTATPSTESEASGSPLQSLTQRKSNSAGSGVRQVISKERPQMTSNATNRNRSSIPSSNLIRAQKRKPDAKNDDELLPHVTKQVKIGSASRVTTLRSHKNMTSLPELDDDDLDFESTATHKPQASLRRSAGTKGSKNVKAPVRRSRSRSSD